MATAATRFIVDVHTHICPGDIRTNREAFFQGEGDFRLIYADKRARLIGATELVAYLDREGVRAACAFGFPWNRDDLTRLCNDYVLDAARRFRGRIIPLACVNPLKGPAAVREVERCLAAGACGVGEIATYRAGLGPDVREALAPIAELCREACVPILLHTNEPVGHAYPGKSPMGPADVYALIRAHPDTRWILAHWGGGLFVYHLLKREAREVLRNVWYDTAAGPYLYRPDVYRHFIGIAGPHRLLFGSDYPLLGLSRYLKDMEESGLGPDQIGAVLGRNALNLFGLEEDR